MGYASFPVRVEIGAGRPIQRDAESPPSLRDSRVTQTSLRAGYCVHTQRSGVRLGYVNSLSSFVADGQSMAFFVRGRADMSGDRVIHDSRE